MEINQNSIIGEIVAENFKAAEVFRSYGVDFCCKGNRSLHDLASTVDIDLENLIVELTNTTSKAIDPGKDFALWPLDTLAEYIEKKHHTYVKAQTPIITQYLNKLCQVHGKANPELYAIQEIFSASSEDLSNHMVKEEQVLFPHIIQMVANVKKGRAYETPHFGTVKNPIQIMMAEHEQEGDRYAEIASLSNNYTIPPSGCNTYMVTYAMLKEFEENLHEHIHLENNILFPGAVRYEESMNN